MLPFSLGAGAVRGRLVRMGPAFDAMIDGHDYPAPVAKLLGQAAAMAAALAGALKFEGIFTLQAQGNGPVTLLLADVTSSGHLRGYARYDADALPANDCDDLSSLMGSGHLAFTIDQGSHTDRYQGIVDLAGPTLADSARLYFQNSEQLDTDIHLACAQQADGSWRSAALMVSRMPADMTGGPILTASEFDETWVRTSMLMSTLSSGEMLDNDLPPAQLLFRLFHQEELLVFDSKPLIAQCRCSRPRIASTLRSFPRVEIEDLADEMGQVVVTCEFCRTAYSFSPDDLQHVYEP